MASNAVAASTEARARTPRICAITDFCMVERGIRGAIAKVEDGGIGGERVATLDF